MKVLACMDDPAPQAGVDCVSKYWIDPPGVLAGFPVEGVAQIVGGVLMLWATWFVIRLVLQWVNRDL